jgi:hypothetical protein
LRILSGAVQFLAFCLLAAAAAALFGAVLWLPEYADLEKARYQLALQQASNAKLSAVIEGNDRYIAEVPKDAVLAKRLAMNQLGYWPQDEIVVVSEAGPGRHSPATVVVADQPEPAPPSGWVMASAQRIADPDTKRNLILLSIAGMAGAVLLFPGGGRRKSSRHAGA